VPVIPFRSSALPRLHLLHFFPLGFSLTQIDGLPLFIRTKLQLDFTSTLLLVFFGFSDTLFERETDDGF
jgi:hypothetical protein